MGWAGGSGGGGQHAAGGRRAGSGAHHLGRARRSRDGRRGPQRHPARGGNTFSGQFNFSGANGALQGSNYTQALKDCGPAGAVRADQRVRRQPHGRRPDHPGQAVVLRIYRQIGGERTVPGMFQNKNAGNPNAWTVDFDRSQQAFNNSLERQATIRLTWQATPRNKFNFHWSEQYNDANYGTGGGAGVPPTTPEASSRCSTSRRGSPLPPGRRRSRAGCSPRPAGACIRPGTASRPRNDGTHNPE